MEVYQDGKGMVWTVLRYKARRLGRPAISIAFSTPADPACRARLDEPELVINLKTAKPLCAEVPPRLCRLTVDAQLVENAGSGPGTALILFTCIKSSKFLSPRSAPKCAGLRGLLLGYTGECWIPVPLPPPRFKILTSH
jgi:hypothetical protein